MNTNYYIKANKISELFSFVLDYGLKLEREESLNYGSYVEYVGNGVRLYLGFDFKDYTFYFNIYKGENTQYSDMEYGKSIKSIEDLILKYNPSIKIQDLQPDYEKGYNEALQLNAELLKKYGYKVLSGKEWF